jgi:HPt (histidine-containing phosphotransfer) domain-containing protein
VTAPPLQPPIPTPLWGERWRIDRGVLQCERFAVSAIDPEIAGQLAADLPRDDFVRIIRTFEEDLGRLAVTLEGAAGSGDLDGYRRAAHSLAGAAAAVGARRLEAVARIAMDHRRSEDPRALAAQVRTEARAALSELAALADNPPTL